MVIDVDLLYARFFLKFSEGCTSIVLSLANLAKVRLIFWLFTNKSKQSNRVLPVNKKRKLAKKRLFESAWFRFQQFEIIEKHFRKSYLLVDTWGQFLSTLFSFKHTYSIGCFALLFVMNFKFNLHVPSQFADMKYSDTSLILEYLLQLYHFRNTHLSSFRDLVDENEIQASTTCPIVSSFQTHSLYFILWKTPLHFQFTYDLRKNFYLNLSILISNFYLYSLLSLAYIDGMFWDRAVDFLLLLFSEEAINITLLQL